MSTVEPGVVGKVKIVLLPLTRPVGASGLLEFNGNPPRLAPFTWCNVLVPPVLVVRVNVPVPIDKSSRPMSPFVIMLNGTPSACSRGSLPDSHSCGQTLAPVPSLWAVAFHSGVAESGPAAFAACIPQDAP